MLDRFVEHIRSKGLLPKGQRVLVGYSGGPDSTCLIHLMHQAGADFVAAHLHHGQREEADVEAKLCEALCTELGIPFVVGKADVPLMSAQMKIGLEEAGRHARYEFFRQAAFRLECGLVATAHTRDDHVETVLMNLTRGTGLTGLAGIQESRDNIVRPLLPFSRSETREYCQAHGLWTHDDPANTDVNFARARIRHRVLPELRCVNPEVEDAVSRLAALVDEEDRYLDAHALHSVSDAEVPLNGPLRFLTLQCEVAFHRQKLLEVPIVLLRRVIRRVTQAFGGEWDSAKLNSVVQGLQLYPASWTCEGGVVVMDWGSELVSIRRTAVVEPFRYPLVCPGATDSDTFGWTIEATSASGPFPTFARNALEVVADAAAIKGNLFLRSCEPGDRVAPMGFDKERKLSDLLGESRLTEAARRRLPIICDILGVVWVPGVCLADRVKPHSETVRGIRLRFGPPATESAELS